MTQALGALVLILMTAAGPAAQPAQTVPTEWKRLFPAIVKVLGDDGIAVGAGIVIGGDGTDVHVLTAYHVVADLLERGESVRVAFRGGPTIAGRLGKHTRRQPGSDLALIEVAAAQVPKTVVRLSIGSSKGLKIGQPVTAIGHPFNAAWLPAINNEILEEELEADPSRFGFKNNGIDHGNSGGPVFLPDGRLIGIVLDRSPVDAIALRIEVATETLRGWRTGVDNLVYPYEAAWKRGSLLYAKRDFKGAYPLLDSAAQDGSADASYLLSKITKGGDPPRSYTEKAAALRHLRVAAKAGSVAAMMDLFDALQSSAPKEAEEWLWAAVEAGDASGMVRLASQYEGKDPSALIVKNGMTAYQWYSDASTKGSVEGALGVARVLMAGTGVVRDPKTACDQYRRALALHAEHGRQAVPSIEESFAIRNGQEQFATPCSSSTEAVTPAKAGSPAAPAPTGAVHTGAGPSAAPGGPVPASASSAPSATDPRRPSGATASDELTYDRDGHAFRGQPFDLMFSISKFPTKDGYPFIGQVRKTVEINKHVIAKKGDVLAGYIHKDDDGSYYLSAFTAFDWNKMTLGVLLDCGGHSKELPKKDSPYRFNRCELGKGRLVRSKLDPSTIKLKP